MVREKTFYWIQANSVTLIDTSAFNGVDQEPGRLQNYGVLVN